MSNQPLEKLEVVIDATSEPLQREAKKAKQVTKDMAESVNNDTRKIKNPLQSIVGGDKSMSTIKSWQQKIKQSMTEAMPKGIIGGTKEGIKNFQLKSGFKVHTEEFKQVEADIQRAEMALDKLYSKRDKMEALGTNAESMQWKSLAYDIRNVEAEVDRYNRKKTTMQENGTDTTRPYSIPKSLLSGAASLVGKGFGGMKSMFSSIVPVIKRTSGAFGTLIQKFKTGIPLLNRFTGGVKQNGNAFGKGIFQVLKYTLGIRSLYALFSKFRTGIVSGFKNLTQYSDSTNASLSMLMSSLTQLKNSLATAFAPILNVIAPVLNVLIQKVSQAASALGMLFASLTGQSTFTKASSVQQDYAASLNSTADSASNANKENKKLQRTLLGFDQINKLDDTSDSDSNAGGSGAGGLSPTDMFEEVPINNKIKEFADKLKEAWKNADFTEIGNTVGKKIKDALDRIDWTKIQSTCSRIAKSIGTFINGFIETNGLSASIGKTIGNAVNTGVGSVNALLETIKFDELGSFLADTLNHAVETIDTSLMGTTLANGVNAVFDTVYAFVSGFDFGKLGEKIGSLITTSIGKIKWNKGGRTLGKPITALLHTLKSIIDNTDFKSLGNGIVQAIKGFFSEIDWEMISGTLSSAFKGLCDFFTGVIQEIDWDSLPHDIVDAVKKFFAGFDWKGSFKSVGELIGSAVAGGIDLIKSIEKILGDIGKKVKEYFVQKFEEAGYDRDNDLLENGKAIVSGLFNGITEALKNVGTWIKESIFQPFVEGFKKTFGIHSPSKEMEPLGENILEGIVEGFSSAFEDVMEAIASLKEKIKEKWDNFTLKVSTKVEDIKKKVSEKWDKVKKFWKSKKALEKVKTTYQDFKEKISNGWDNVISYWNDKKILKEVKTTYQNFKSKVSEKWNLAKNWWNNKPSLKEVKAAYENIKEKISEKWNTAKDWWNNKPSLKEVKAAYENIKEKLSEKWAIARTWWDNTRATLKEISVSFPDILQGLKEKWNSMKSWWDGLGLKFPSISIGKFHITYDKEGFGAKMWQVFGFDGTPNISFYANGGFPDTGQLFVANENGPELVGKMGNRTTVANQGQIAKGFADAIYPAMYNAVAEAMMQVYIATNTNSGQNGQVIEIPIYLDGKELGRQAYISIEELIRSGQIKPIWT